MLSIFWKNCSLKMDCESGNQSKTANGYSRSVSMFDGDQMSRYLDNENRFC